MGRRRSSSIAGSPLLIGAVTTLIVVVAVYLSYNANNGLPFVPTYNIKVELPQASGLQDQNQVRLGGTRVGTISGLSPHENPKTGLVTAIATLKLEKKVEPLPANTTAEVQSVSTIGLKYLELKQGNSVAKIKAGQTIPLSQTREPVNIEELFNMFDKPTRTAIKINTNQFGNGLAGRGQGLNKVIEELKPLVTNAVPVLHNLASPQTGLHEFFVALNRSSEETAPVAQQNANSWTYSDKFFTDWASVSRSIEEANVGGPPSLEQAIYSLPHEAPFYENATRFMDLLRPSAKSLVTVAPQLGHAFSVGATNLSAATQLNDALLESSQALAEFARNPIAQVGLEEFTNTLETANPLLAGIAPSQAFCNYWTLAFRNLASLETENIGVGTLARAGFILAPSGANNEGYPASAPANGPSEEKEAFSTKIVDKKNNHLHANMYPNTDGPGQPAVCEAGNETYIPEKTTIGNLPAADVSKNRELTTREQNVYGEKYPEATLKALGLAKPKSSSKSKSKGTGK